MPSTATVRSILSGLPIECGFCDAGRETKDINECACKKGVCPEHGTKCRMCGENFFCADCGVPSMTDGFGTICRGCYGAELDDAAEALMTSPTYGIEETLDMESLREVA